ncbi:MAG: tripartite tricarboxylate transporter substrate binding protein [Xanthobacteraceae bacterium]|nr:tripartite tricarboxylate transporter substrate binding protein [Xanthobacteraceae bacterium]
MSMLLRIAAVVAFVIHALPASAQQYPSRTVRLVVPFAAGGTGDIVARVLSDRLAQSLGQSVVVENRPGATGALGSKAVLSAAPDGHTILVGQTGEMAINQHWAKGLGYDPVADFQPIALATVVPLALVVPGKASYSSVQEMLAVAKARGLAFASSGAATPGHFAGEVLKYRTKSNMNHVPYNGAGPALNDILGGHVDLFFSGLPAAVPHVKAGTIKLLAVSTARRSGFAPDVPTVAEASGVKDFDIALWQGFFAPRGTPREIVVRLHAEINKALQQPEVKSRLLEAGAEVNAISIDEFAAFAKSESAKFLRIIKDANLKPE